MKSRMIVLLAAAAMLLAPSVRGAPPDLRTQHLFHQLKILPDGATPFRTVDKLVLALVKRDPLRSVKYFKTALSKIDDRNGESIAKTYNNTFKLGWQIAKVVKRSGLPDAQIKRILSQIGHIVEPGYSGAPSPTPTPEPTP